MTLRESILRKADEIGLSAFDLARLVRKDHGEWVVSTDHMERYLSGEKDMTSDKLDKVMRTLGLTVTNSPYPHQDDTRGNQ